MTERKNKNFWLDISRIIALLISLFTIIGSIYYFTQPIKQQVAEIRKENEMIRQSFEQERVDIRQDLYQLDRRVTRLESREGGEK